jgi:phage/plasmid-like protein (TIGR03299 family)
MPAYFEQGFSVRQPMWHGLGEVLADYPGREKAMELAGHDFTLIETPFYLPTALAGDDDLRDGDTFTFLPDDDGMEHLNRLDPAKGWKAIRREDSGELMHVARDSYTIIQNTVGWDVVDAMVGEGVKYETGLTLKGGATCSVLAWLDEPVTIPGDDSTILPWVNVSWHHDGSGSLSARPTSIRTVCWNTQTAAEAQGRRLGREFVFRHTANVMARVEEAKLAMLGVRDAHAEYIELATELASLPITAKGRELFVTQFIPMPPEALISDRVAKNVEDARGAVRALFDGPTIPDDHRFTAYGLHLAGGEYLDHLRGYRSSDTYFGRCMLRHEGAKAKLTTLIRDVVAEAV